MFLVTDYRLSPQQFAFISALSSGVNTTRAAEQAGIHRNTMNVWRRDSPPFQHALAEALADRAAETIHELLPPKKQIELLIETQCAEDASRPARPGAPSPHSGRNETCPCGNGMNPSLYKKDQFLENSYE